MSDEMERCSEGHFFNPREHLTCPWCGPEKAGADKHAGPETVDPTRPVAEPTQVIRAATKEEDMPRTRAFREQEAPSSSRAPGVTQRYVEPGTSPSFDPVVGWLVCTEGPDRGRDYRIRIARNFIGRAPSMHIAITGDNTISREKHAILTYETKKQTFWIQPGDSAGLVYLNGDIVNLPMQLKEKDVVEIGQSKLLFVPLCSSDFQW